MNAAVGDIVRTNGSDGSKKWSESADSRERDYAAAEAALLARFDLPVRSIGVRLDEPATRVLEMGEGAPVLMMHGGGGFSALWAPLMAELRGARLLAVDRPGCGMSDGFDYRGVGLREHAVRFVESVMNSLGLDRVAIAANSMGATWSLWFAAEHPE